MRRVTILVSVATLLLGLVSCSSSIDLAPKQDFPEFKAGEPVELVKAMIRDRCRGIEFKGAWREQYQGEGVWLVSLILAAPTGLSVTYQWQVLESSRSVEHISLRLC